MVKQDVGKGLLVLGQEQTFNSSGGESGEGIIGGSEDREGNFSAQSFDQFCGGQSSHKGREAFVSNSDLNDGLLFFHGFFGRRQEHCIDNVDHAVGSLNVGDDDLGFVDVHIAHVNLDGDVLAKHRGGAGEGGYICSHDLAGNDMVKQDVGEGLLVLGQKQAFDGAFGKSGESVISGGEDSEGTFTFEGVNQLGGTESGGEGGEATIRNGGVNNVEHFRHGGRLRHGCGFRNSGRFGGGRGRTSCQYQGDCDKQSDEQGIAFHVFSPLQKNLDTTICTCFANVLSVLYRFCKDSQYRFPGSNIFIIIIFFILFLTSSFPTELVSFVQYLLKRHTSSPTPKKWFLDPMNALPKK